MTHESASARLDRLDAWVKAYRPAPRVAECGTIVSVGDGIAWINGLPSAAADDILAFADGSRGLVFDLAPGRVGAVLLRATEELTAGTMAYIAPGALTIAVGDALLGRVIDPLGRPLDGDPLPQLHEQRPLERRSPPIIDRDFVREPLYTGNRVIDTMLPIGRGQRELLIGDEGLGRSSIAVDTVIAQHDQDVRCIYVLCGQKRSTVVRTIETLRANGALAYTVVVVGEAGALPGLKHLAPFAGCAIAEHWMEQGDDTLVVYDDLSMHALNYRELSLLLRRPPGREAYPGDIFSVHARLLERSTCLGPARGGGSMTALPIVETQQGEIAAYIPTNLISITDGQIYFDATLFAGGFRPAIDVSRSVSRIGGAAQHRTIRDEASHMKMDYLRFLELETFSRFGARLEESMEAALQRGRILREILKQDRLAPERARFQLAWMVAFNDGLLDSGDPETVPGVLATIAAGLDSCDLTLSDARDRWSEAVATWVAATAESKSGP
jgi:F-type H+-transporting ATPase subunit alpha